MIEITRLTKTGGPLTKRICLTSEGEVISNGSACVMSMGTALRARIATAKEFAALIGRLEPHEAIALGALRSDLPDRVDITTKLKLDALNGNAAPSLIARTAEHISYRAGQRALALIDIDTKGMPKAAAQRIADLGGFVPALRAILPDLAQAATILRPSTSAGIYRTDTNEKFPGSGGFHLFVLVRDGGDIERFLRTLHERAWLAGLGWSMVGAGGQLLERSIVDRMVGGPERLVFEGAPVLDAPLAQDGAARAPIVQHGAALDTVAACPPLTIVEQSRLRELQAKEGQRLAPDAARAREAFTARQTKQMAERTGMAPERAASIIAHQCGGTLLPDVVLPFDEPDLAGCTVADVLADPGRFVGATLADPVEGTSYGRTKAMIMRRADGSPWINSFAHGRTAYELRYDAAAVRAALDKAPADAVVALFVRLAQIAELDEAEAEELRDLAAERSGIGKRAIDRDLKTAQRQRTGQQRAEEKQRRTAERRDPRPQIEAPAPDAPWLPTMGTLNEVLGASTAAEPPMRDIDGVVAQVRVRRVPNMHMLTAKGSNQVDSDETRLPPPEQPLLSRLTEPQLAEIIERHIDYVCDTGRPVHLATPFVKHFHTRQDDALPLVAAIATLPIVLADGTILAGEGLDRKRGIVFRIPHELLAILPTPGQCDETAVFEAFRFLIDEWLVDVTADFAGKCALIAAALTVIERSTLAERPCFFVTAGRRGGGKTTTLIMLLSAVTGVRPPAAAWSPNEEERRKALLAYLLEAVSAIVWDNIPRGTQISCPHIEKSCTTAFYSDRRLGVSELIAVAAAVIHFFTGNNIAPRGDLASRSLQIRLKVDRADPENRPFVHSDPIEWTEAHRGRILAALYTILLGNPNLRPGSNTPPQTRFKMWWRLVGSAVEHAADTYGERVAALVIDANPNCPPSKLNFRDIFLAQEGDDEESASLSDALVVLDAIVWPGRTGSFQAADLARLLNEPDIYASAEHKERTTTLREFLFPNLSAAQTITAKSAGKRLKRHVGDPVKHGDKTLCLMETEDTHTKTLSFHVKKT